MNIALRRLACLLALLCCATPRAQAASPTTIAAARLLDVASGQIQRDVVVTVDGGRIVSVAPRTAGVVVGLDLGDVTLVPGLIDCHVHLIGGEELTPYQALQETAARAAIEGVANARKTLDA